MRENRTYEIEQITKEKRIRTRTKLYSKRETMKWEINQEKLGLESVKSGRALKKRKNADLFVTRTERKRLYGLGHNLTKKFVHQTMYNVTRRREFHIVLKELLLTIHKVELVTERKITTTTQTETIAEAITKLRFNSKIFIEQPRQILAREDNCTNIQEKKQFANLFFQVLSRRALDLTMKERI
jgi:hypothetical protein